MKRRNSTNKIYDLILNFNRHFFSPIVVIGFGTLFIDTFTYPGFIAKAIGIPAHFFMMLAGLSYSFLIAQRVFFNSEMTEETMLVLRANIILLPFYMLGFHILRQLERSHYPNYVFSAFHIHMGLFQQVVIFSVYLSLLHVLNHSNKIVFSFVKRKGFSNPYDRRVLGPVLFFISILLLLSTQVYTVYGAIAEDLIDIARHPLASLKERRKEKFGLAEGVYDFFNAHTPPESVIAVPPQNRWGLVGNIGFSRYFVYPRFLIHPEDFTPQTLPDIDYYVIARTIEFTGDETYQIWPEDRLPAEEIYLYNEVLQTTEKIDRKEYDPRDPLFKDRWGLIKVPKEQK